MPSGPRFAGFCHRCQRRDRTVQTYHEHAAKTLCDPCAATLPTPAVAPAENNLEAEWIASERPEGAYADVFKALTDFAFLTPHCHPSEELLAERAGVNRRTVVRAKAWLRDRGWISWTRRWRPGSKWQHCVYEIHCGWHRPHRKAVLKWLDRRRERRHVSLSELPPLPVEKETRRSKGRRARTSRDWRAAPAPRFTAIHRDSKTPREPNGSGGPSMLQVISDEMARRAGGREAALAFASWSR